MPTKVRRIRVSSAFATAKPEGALERGNAVVDGLTGNDKYTDSPISPATLKAGLDTLNTTLGAAADGSKKAKAARDHALAEVIRMLRILARYVEAACNNDRTTLLSSGFEEMVVTRSAPQPVPPTSIRKIDYGTSGQLLVKIQNVPKAWSYELRYAPLEPTGVPGPWTSQPITAVISPISFTGLTPGTNYAFQVRALGRLGFSDWSDTVTKMCA